MNVQLIRRLLESGECDRYGYWKPNAIMSFMQELAGLHAARLGTGRQAMMDRHQAVWVVTRHEMVIDRYPAIADTIVGKSFPTRARRGIYPRFYLVEDEAGQRLVRGSSFWTLADIRSRAMTQVPEIAAAMPDNEGLDKPLPYPGGAQELMEGREILYRWKPLYTDIDRNGHVNNSRTADWALCFLSECVDLKRQPIHTLKVTFHQEMLPEEEVDLRFMINGDAFSLRCQKDERTCVTLSGTVYGGYNHAGSEA
ncbi:MAG: thioesterase [Eubacteriales bacterium]|nr:thioesterase [Eubacteriales bacterium]